MGFIDNKRLRQNTKQKTLESIRALDNVRLDRAYEETFKEIIKAEAAGDKNKVEELLELQAALGIERRLRRRGVVKFTNAKDTGTD